MCYKIHIISSRCSAVGWTGFNCLTPICSASCVHGSCKLPGECNCDAHWTHANCDICEMGWSGVDCNTGLSEYQPHQRLNANQACFPALCAPGCLEGSCVAPGECTCKANLQGPNCDECNVGYDGDDCERMFCEIFVAYYSDYMMFSLSAVCSPFCLHGTCTYPNGCDLCEQGFHGSNCSVSLCEKSMLIYSLNITYWWL